MGDRSTVNSRLRRFVRSLIAGSTGLLLAGCGGPFWQFPGGALDGPQMPYSTFGMLPDGGIMQLETSPNDAYSVNIGYVVIEGVAYIDPADSRQWYQNIVDDPRIRVRWDGVDVVHPALAIPETDPAVTSQFEVGRHVLRIAAR